ALSPNIAGATYSKIDGNVNPFRLVELYIKASKKNQVQFSFYNPVIDIEKENGIYKIITKSETYFAKQLILAGGPWTKEIGNMLGVDIPVKQVRGQIIVTEPLAPILKHTIGGMRQADNGEVLIGYSKEEVGYDRRTTLDVIQDTAKMAMDYLPDLAKANIVRCFSGVRVMPNDGLPILGPIPTMDNAYIAVMHSGITLSPLVGTLMTELLTEGETSIDLNRLKLDRFNEFNASVKNTVWYFTKLIIYKEKLGDVNNLLGGKKMSATWVIVLSSVLVLSAAAIFSFWIGRRDKSS